MGSQAFGDAQRYVSGTHSDVHFPALSSRMQIFSSGGQTGSTTTVAGPEDDPETASDDWPTVGSFAPPQATSPANANANEQMCVSFMR